MSSIQQTAPQAGNFRFSGLLPKLRLPTGLRGRLFLAFAGISSFAILAALAGLVAFVAARRALDEVTATKLPVTLSAMELMRHSERVVATGPALLNAVNPDAILAVTATKNAQLQSIRKHLAQLKETDADSPSIREIEATIESLETNLDEIETSAMQKDEAASQRNAILRNAFGASQQFAKIWSVRFEDLQKQVVELQRTAAARQADPSKNAATIDALDEAMQAILPLDQLQRRTADSFQLLVGGAETADLDELARLKTASEKVVRDIDGLVSGVDLDISTALLPAIKLLHESALGQGGLFAVREAELKATAESRRLVAENTRLSSRLSDAAEVFVAASRHQMEAAAGGAVAVQNEGGAALGVIVVLSLVSSVLIVWLYVGRNIVSRLTGIGAVMAGIAAGRRDVVVDTRGVDEIAAMGRTVEVFRQHAIERDALLVERAEAAVRLEGLVEERTKELNKTVGTLEEASEVIASSIRYASRIQRSILPDSELIEATLSDRFILWEPRDVVSGDVYWLARWGDGLLIVVGDCTGHGVPGAFVTLIANSALERALLDVDPGAVGTLISRMNQLIKTTLKQTEQGGESDDGMDLGICYISADHTRLTFAGAGISLFSAAPGKILAETKGGKRGIGYRRVPFDQAYVETDLPVVPGMRFYMASDGIIDQIGGERHRAFGLARLLTLLDRDRDQPMADQKDLLIAALSDYQGQEIRRDDVLVLGFRLRGSVAASRISLD
jgi:serine phosphatase RsbU (regulator of sigma subunit)